MTVEADKKTFEDNTFDGINAKCRYACLPAIHRRSNEWGKSTEILVAKILYRIRKFSRRMIWHRIAHEASA